jgi:hypothetical protein
MKEQLTNKLHSYLVHNHLDLLISLQEDHRLTHYLEDKVDSIRDLCEELQAQNRPASVIEALCMEELTKDLRPSRFKYMRALLQDEFEADYRRISAGGMLSYEVISLTGACEPIFEVFAFGEEHEDSKALRSAIINMVTEYLAR